MTLTTTGVARQARPHNVVWIGTLLLVLGIGAVGGGWAMTFGIGDGNVLPDEYLEALPLVNNWLVPGLVLLLGFGVGSLVAAYGVLQRPHWNWTRVIDRVTGHHWSWIATIAIGVGQVIWIGLEVISIPFSWLMPTFGLVGLALALLPLTPSARDHLQRS
jgi:hypothetical protein